MPGNDAEYLEHHRRYQRLQSQDLDLLIAMDDVKALRTAPQNLRDGGEIHEIHSRTLQICEELDVDIPVVRKRRQLHRINEHPETKE